VSHFLPTSSFLPKQKSRKPNASTLHVFVQFGHPEKRRLSATVGMNPKGGMDNTKFHKYLLLLVACLYPDASDVVGKRVLIKCDSGPGHDNLES
jgi:hypothetical protein